MPPSLPSIWPLPSPSAVTAEQPRISGLSAGADASRAAGNHAASCLPLTDRQVCHLLAPGLAATQALYKAVPNEVVIVCAGTHRMRLGHTALTLCSRDTALALSIHKLHADATQLQHDKG